VRKELPPPIAPHRWRESETYLRGCELFNAGYYWEAHESWELLWHAHGRKGAIADVLKGLIKLGAAGVKVRERQPRGVTTHARRASALFESARRETGGRLLGLDLAVLARAATRVADCPPDDPGPRDARVTRVFALRIEPRDDPTSKKP
jgi:predicted metal-dependent hydrolase